MRIFAFSLVFLAVSGSVNASDVKNTVSLGYANSHYSGVISGNSPGFNIKYGIENTRNNLGLITSITSTSQELNVKKQAGKRQDFALISHAGPLVVHQ